MDESFFVVGYIDTDSDGRCGERDVTWYEIFADTWDNPNLVVTPADVEPAADLVCPFFAGPAIETETAPDQVKVHVVGSAFDAVSSGSSVILSVARYEGGSTRTEIARQTTDVQAGAFEFYVDLPRGELLYYFWIDTNASGVCEPGVDLAWVEVIGIANQTATSVSFETTWEDAQSEGAAVSDHVCTRFVAQP